MDYKIVNQFSVSGLALQNWVGSSVMKSERKINLSALENITSQTARLVAKRAVEKFAAEWGFLIEENGINVKHCKFSGGVDISVMRDEHTCFRCSFAEEWAHENGFVPRFHLQNHNMI